jgi:hypothetical protein
MTPSSLVFRTFRISEAIVAIVEPKSGVEIDPRDVIVFEREAVSESPGSSP